MSRQAKSPSLAHDLLALGDIYLTLGWLAIQRLRFGPLWPWEPQSDSPSSSVVTFVRPPEEESEDAEVVTSARR